MKINILAPITIAFTLFLGFTGRVDWWVIALVWAVALEINVTLK